jgi:hypothetical protein
MYKTLKWVYRLGVLHERRRIKLLIANFRREKPTFYGKTDEEKSAYNRESDVWSEVEYVLGQLLDPYATYNDIQAYVPPAAPIDKD